MKKNMDRRSFLKQSSWLAGTFLLLNVIGLKAFAQGRRQKGGETVSGELKLVDPSKGTPVTVNYVHHQSEVKNEKIKIVKQGVAFKEQFCRNCVLYTKHGDMEGKEVGKCALFPNQLVRAEGWCTSWNKKS